MDIQTCIIKPCKEDCSGFTAGDRIDGVYNISPNKSLTESVPVYCEFSSDGAWTVVQKRFDGSVYFNRTWQEYKAGFGDVNGEYWLGNDAIHEITSRGTYRLKVRLTDWDNVTKFANYTAFLISNESEGFRLTIDGYSGDADDSMAHNNGQRFTTKDRDNDRSPLNCAEVFGSAGWCNQGCTYANLNGIYYHSSSATDHTGIWWYHWHGNRYSLKATTMMI